MALVFLSSLMTWTEGDTRCVVDADMDELPADAEMAVDHARLKAPHQPSRPHWEQPIEAPQLAKCGADTVYLLKVDLDGDDNDASYFTFDSHTEALIWLLGYWSELGTECVWSLDPMPRNESLR